MVCWVDDIDDVMMHARWLTWKKELLVSRYTQRAGTRSVMAVASSAEVYAHSSALT